MYQQNKYTPLKIKRNEQLAVGSMLTQYAYKALIEFITWFDGLTLKYSK